MAKKGKFTQEVVYDYKGDRIEGAGTEIREITQLVENSYFFGQFMAYYIVLRLVKLVGYERAMQFVDKKFQDIGSGNPSFLSKAKEIGDKALQYYTESMEV